MNTATKPWKVDFNLDIPKSYRRTFYLKDRGCLLVLEVRGRTCSFRVKGDQWDGNNSYHLDWLEECMFRVRMEFEP
jgi:hypothetical protein